MSSLAWEQHGDTHYLNLNGEQVASVSPLEVVHDDLTGERGLSVLVYAFGRRMSEFPVPTVEEARRIVEEWFDRREAAIRARKDVTT